MEQNQIEDIRNRLDPKRLREEIESELKPEKQVISDLKPKADPREHKEYVFDFTWKDGRGRDWKGEFKNKILDIGDRQAVGILRARMGAGVPSDSLDPLTQEINLMLAHMSVSLIGRPDWADDLRALTDIRLLQELYSEVLAHEGTFLGYRSAEEES